LESLGPIPSLAEDTEERDFISHLIPLCSLVTGQGPDHPLALDSKVVSDHARIAHDYHCLISALVTGEPIDANLLVSGKVSEKQVIRSKKK